ncbi:MAG: hypothetical protein WC455_27380 [Dehalococcoidia bacterium]|jgi:hypothetical protein
MSDYRFINEGKQHLHTLRGRPLTGVSTVGNVISKPLTWWAAECAAVECLEHGWHIPTIRAEYEAAVKSGNKSAEIKKIQARHPEFKAARFAHNVKKEKAADEGTDYHACVEGFIKAKIAGTPFTPDPIIAKFVEWSDAEVKRFLFSECHTYSEPLWIGGIADFGYLNNKDEFCVGDCKRSGPYAGQYLQVGGYDLALSETGGFTADGAQLHQPFPPALHHVVCPSKGEYLMLDGRDVEENRKGFKACLGLYRTLERINAIIEG